MRDPNRIEEFCERLKEAWRKYPDLRFFQLMCCVQSVEGSDLFYVEDDETIKMIEDFASRG